jgi:aflatoxin B1 aldehyde reductase
VLAPHECSEAHIPCSSTGLPPHLSQVAEVCLICKYKGYVRPTLYQGAYNAINRTPEYDLVPTLRRHGLDWVVYNPLAGGMLTGRFLSKSDEKTGRFAGEGVAELYAKRCVILGHSLRPHELTLTDHLLRYWKDQTFAALNIINEAAKKSGIKMTELAIRWVQHHSALKMRSDGGNDGESLDVSNPSRRKPIVLPGIVIGASSLAQLKENMEYFAKGPLPQEVVDACEDAWAEMAGARPLYYHGEYEYEYDTVRALHG